MPIYKYFHPTNNYSKKQTKNQKLREELEKIYKKLANL
jgi:hypothetical protein